MAVPKPSASLKRKMSFGATFIFVAASGLSETLSESLSSIFSFLCLEWREFFSTATHWT